MESKKRIYASAAIFAGAALILLYFASTLLRGGASHKKAEDATLSGESSVLPSFMPQITVVIDAGHGGRDHGESGTDSGVYEDVLNLDTSKKLQKELTERGIAVIMTRETDEALAAAKKEDMKERRRIMHESGADICVSIHMNKFTDRTVHGPMVFYTKGDDESQKLAECILKSICTELDIPMRLPNTGDYYVIRDSKIPAVIVECGFLSNPTDERLLCSEEYRGRIAKAVAVGICFFKDNRY